jgi:hypothetical protein
MSLKREFNSSSFVDVRVSTIFRFVLRFFTYKNLHRDFMGLHYFCFNDMLLSPTHITGKVFPGQKLIKIGDKDVEGLDKSDMAVLIIGDPGVPS